MNQDWHFVIRGDLVYNNETVYLHPENFVNVIRVSRYIDRMFPTMLARLKIDKNLFDHIIKNADNIEIHITISKFMMSEDRKEKSPEEIYIDDMFQVTVGSDINYNKELDYIEEDLKNTKIEDKFKETYIGLISKKCIDTNKIVVNDVILNSMMQDVILSYFDQKETHLLFEPFHNNEPLKQLSLPPIDSLYTLLEHLNGIKVFYNTKYLFFIDEPNVTYLMSKSGQGLPMVGEEHNEVIIRMNSSTDDFNMSVGMNNDGETDAYIIEASVHDSNYTIDNDTVKIINTIEAVINPSIDHTRIAEDLFKSLKEQIKAECAKFLTDIALRCLSEPNIGSLVSSAVEGMTHAVGAIADATEELQTSIKAGVGSMIESIPTTIEVDMGDFTIDVPFLSGAAKSIMKSFTDGQFITGALNSLIQEEVTNNLGSSLFDTASEAYKHDFVDNFISSVTYVNAQDVSKATQDMMTKIGEALDPCLQKMADTVTSKMGSFQGLTDNIGGILDKVVEVRDILEKAALLAGATGAGAGSVLDGLSSSILDQSREFEDLLGTMKGITEKYNILADHNHDQGLLINTNLETFANIITNLSDTVSNIGSENIKDRLSTDEPPRIFGDLNPAIFQMGGCFGGGNSILSDSSTGGNILDALSNIDIEGMLGKLTEGIINFEDIAKLKDNIEAFDLKNLGDLGLTSIGFNLNLGEIFPLLDGNTLQIGPSGVKIVKVKNDNPNELKNIKFDMELDKSTLSISKIGVDPSVFTPNKRFTIQNYTPHANKDGHFLLNEKIEIFTNEDGTFLGTTQLSFSKLPDDSTSPDNVNSDDTKAAKVSDPDPQKETDLPNLDSLPEWARKAATSVMH